LKERVKAIVHDCSKNCQELDWPDHKKCNRETASANEAPDGADPNGMTKLMSQLWVDDKNKVRMILKSGSDFCAVDFQGFTALDYAISRGNTEIVKRAP
jgi:ankyrin repeat protein